MLINNSMLSDTTLSAKKNSTRSLQDDEQSSASWPQPSSSSSMNWPHKRSSSRTVASAPPAAACVVEPTRRSSFDAPITPSCQKSIVSTVCSSRRSSFDAPSCPGHTQQQKSVVSTVCSSISSITPHSSAHSSAHSAPANPYHDNTSIKSHHSSSSASNRETQIKIIRRTELAILILLGVIAFSLASYHGGLHHRIKRPELSRSRWGRRLNGSNNNDSDGGESSSSKIGTIVELYDPNDSNSYFAIPAIITNEFTSTSSFNDDMLLYSVQNVITSNTLHSISSKFIHPYVPYVDGTMASCNISTLRKGTHMVPCAIISHSIRESSRGVGVKDSPGPGRGDDGEGNNKEGGMRGIVIYTVSYLNENDALVSCSLPFSRVQRRRDPTIVLTKKSKVVVGDDSVGDDSVGDEGDSSSVIIEG